MKKAIVVLTLLFVVFLNACNFRTSAPLEVPQLYVSLNTDSLPIQNFQAAGLSYSWYSGATDRQGNHVRGSGASADHPLDFWLMKSINLDAFTAELDGGSSEIELRFSDNFPPHTVYVRRWSIEFIGRASEVQFQYEPVKLEGNIIRISDDGTDYIYEVDAKWEQGRSSYAFRINSGK